MWVDALVAQNGPDTAPWPHSSAPRATASSGATIERIGIAADEGSRRYCDAICYFRIIFKDRPEEKLRLGVDCALRCNLS